MAERTTLKLSDFAGHLDAARMMIRDALDSEESEPAISFAVLRGHLQKAMSMLAGSGEDDHRDDFDDESEESRDAVALHGGPVVDSARGYGRRRQRPGHIDLTAIFRKSG